MGIGSCLSSKKDEGLDYQLFSKETKKNILWMINIYFLVNLYVRYQILEFLNVDFCGNIVFFFLLTLC